MCLEKSLSNVSEVCFYWTGLKSTLVNVDGFDWNHIYYLMNKMLHPNLGKELEHQPTQRKFRAGIRGEIYKSDSRGHVFNPTEKYLSAVPENKTIF